MTIPTYLGVVEQGRIRLTEGVELPENAQVYVVVPDALTQRIVRIPSPRLADPQQASRFAKQIIETETDVQL